MYEAKLEQRRVIVFILILFGTSILLSRLSKNLPEQANTFIYLSSPQQDLKETVPLSSSSDEGIISIDVNSAGLSELEKIPGVGKVLASRIVSYRDRNGRFSSKEDLIKIKGIGRKKLSLMEKYIRVE